MVGQMFYKRRGDGALVPINPGPQGERGPVGPQGPPGPAGDGDATIDTSGLLPKASLRADGTTAELDPETEWVGRWDILDDSTPTSGWPDRLVFRYEWERTGWFNEYGEFRVTGAKNSTIPLKVNAKSPSASNRILQVNDDQGGNEVFAVDVDGAEVTSPHGMLPLMPVWTGTQAEYDALTPQPGVVYMVT